MVSFATTQAALAWLGAGAGAGWVTLTPLQGFNTGASPIPNSLWTGNGTDSTGLILPRIWLALAGPDRTVAISQAYLPSGIGSSMAGRTTPARS